MKLSSYNRVADLLLTYLTEAGSEYLFGLTGKTISPIFDAVLDNPNITAITATHEGGAAMMAYGYAAASRKIGICVATAGGAVTNLMTGVETAQRNSAPMVVLTGNVPRKQFGKGGFQAGTGEGRTSNAAEILAPICKFSKMVIDPSQAPSMIRTAIRSATSGRPGAAHLNFPIDILLSPAETEAVPFHKYNPPNNQGCDSKAVEDALRLINDAKRPAILMGGGAFLSKCDKKIVEFSEALNIPIATTPQGKGSIHAEHSLLLGIYGLCGHKTAFSYINNADLLFIIGTSLGEFVTNFDSDFVSGKKVIHLDIDPEEIGKNYPVDLALTGDANNIIEQLIKAFKEDPIAKKDFDTALNWSSNPYIDPHKMLEKTIPIRPQRVLRELRSGVPENTIFLADSGAHCGWAIHYLPIHKGGGFIPQISLGSMGSGICATIGTKLAWPENPVVCIAGDGAMRMNGLEMATAAQYNIPVGWIVFNDNSFGMCRIGSRSLYNRESGCDLSEVDFAKVSQGLGINSFTIFKPDELLSLLPEAISSNKPFLFDVKIDASEYPPIGARLKYGDNAEEDMAAHLITPN